MSYQEHINSGVLANEEVTSREETDFLTEYDGKDTFFLKNNERSYERQFYSMYQHRLSVLKDRVEENAQAKWGDGTKKYDGQTIRRKDKILDIASRELCWVSGTIYSDMKNKLNILLDVEKGTDDVLPESPPSYMVPGSEEMPTVMLEDESGRAILHNDEFLKKNTLVTGCVVAVLGIEIQAGIFEILDVAYPTKAPQRPLKKTNNKRNKVAFVSGLNISSDVESDLRVELLKQYLCGELGGQNDFDSMSEVSHLVIVGDAISPLESRSSAHETFVSNYGSKNTSKFNDEAFRTLDALVDFMIPSISISIIPGPNDPSEICLPQQPLHKSFFTSNKHFLGGKNFDLLTNPTWLELSSNNLRMLGTSGQNIRDIMKYLTPDTLLDPNIIISLMESCINWQTVAPTAPDTLYCYPFQNFDPFTFVDETPHVYFVGNQDSFQYSNVLFKRSSLEKHQDNTSESISLISIPRFCDTGELVVFDPSSLTCQVVNFSV